MVNRTPRSTKEMLEAVWQDKKVRSACGPTRWRHRPSNYKLYEQEGPGLFYTETVRVNSKTSARKPKRQIEYANFTTDN